MQLEFYNTPADKAILEGSQFWKDYETNNVCSQINQMRDTMLAVLALGKMCPTLIDLIVN